RAAAGRVAGVQGLLGRRLRPVRPGQAARGGRVRLLAPAAAAPRGRGRGGPARGDAPVRRGRDRAQRRVPPRVADDGHRPTDGGVGAAVPGAPMVSAGTTSWLPGRDAPAHLPFQDWGRPGVGLHGEPLAPWPAYRFRVPVGWPSGVYAAVLVEGDAAGRDRSHPDRTTSDGRDARALFVVRPDRPRARILYKLPVLTYHAYNLIDGRPYDPANGSGHWCLYNAPRPDELPRPVPAGVGLHRPGGGTGAVPYDFATNPDPYDPTPRQTFAHWDARFVGWLEAAGYRADYCTDVDLHRGGRDLLDPYRLLVSVGHDEYWSDAMRDAVEGFTAAGGNAAFFGGNTAWWRVVFTDEVTFARVGFWHELGRPENAMIGVSFRHGGERDRTDHPVPVGYRVQHAGCWVYAGTGLRDGDVFGDGP